MYAKTGNHIWTEPRGEHAGYHWPQYSVHRGLLHLSFYEALLERAGPGCVQTGWAATGYRNEADTAVLRLRSRYGKTKSVRGDLLLGADGIHSAIREQMYPEQGDPT